MFFIIVLVDKGRARFRPLINHFVLDLNYNKLASITVNEPVQHERNSTHLLLWAWWISPFILEESCFVYLRGRAFSFSYDKACFEEMMIVKSAF